MLALALDKEWASFGETEAGLDEVSLLVCRVSFDHADFCVLTQSESISPPLFPRRLDSAYYSRPERASTPQESVRQVLPCDLDQVGKSLFDLGGKVEMDVELDDDLGPIEILDAIRESLRDLSFTSLDGLTTRPCFRQKEFLHCPRISRSPYRQAQPSVPATMPGLWV